MLSGAVMAVRAVDFDHVGGFDERFALYFEESDFLRRMTALRKRIAHVPAARCRHLFNQSAAQVADEAAVRYAQSELRYLEKWNGPCLARALKKLERPLPSVDAQPLRLPLLLDRDDVVIEVSPLSTFTTAAGHFPRGREVEVPREILASMRGDLYLRAVARGTGDILGTYRINA
jgi:GT2 family glycosyltransferase